MRKASVCPLSNRLGLNPPASDTIQAPGESFTGTVDSIAFGSGSTFSLLPAENASGSRGDDRRWWLDSRLIQIAAIAAISRQVICLCRGLTPESGGYAKQPRLKFHILR